jgi:hypothetical protein
MSEASSMNGEEEECVEVIGGNAKGKRSLGRPRHWWDRIGLAQDRDKWRALANAAMDLRVP